MTCRCSSLPSRENFYGVDADCIRDTKYSANIILIGGSMKYVCTILTIIIVLSSFCFAQQDTLTILFTSDTHSSLAPIGSRSDDLRGTIGGIARAASLIGSVKMNEPNVLTLHGGDMFIGDIFYNTYFGIAELKLMSAIGYDVLTLGNHEFDLGPAMLQMAFDSSMKESPMSIVSSNIIFPDDEKFRLDQYVLPYTIRQFGSLKIGIFGLTTPETNALSNPSPVCFNENCCDCAAKTVQVLKDSGCTFIICLSHIGYTHDSMMAANISGIDLIISAHDHSSKDITGYPNPSGRTTWVSQTDAFYTEMGKIQLLITDQSTLLLSARHISLDSKIEEEPTVKTEVDNLIAEVEQKFGPMFTKAVSYATDNFTETSEYLPGDGPKETAVGNLVTDAFRKYTGTDIAIEPGGSTAQPLFRGPIVGDDLFRAVGYGFNKNNSLGYRLVTFTVTGESLAVALEKCAATIETNDEFFPQVSGMQYSYSPNAPAGKRIRDIKVNDLPLDPAKRYSVTTNELAAALLTTMLGINVSDMTVFENMSEYQALLRYVSKEESISPAIEGRITVVPMTQLIGTYTVGQSGKFATLESAFSSLSNNGILGPVTLFLTDELYDLTTTAAGSLVLNGPIAGASSNNRITIRPAENTNVTIKGNGKAVIQLNNVSYCTLDGIGAESKSGMTVQALINKNYANNHGIELRGNSDFNEIKNITVGTDDYARYNSFAISLMNDSIESPDYCTISGNNVTSGDAGIIIWGTREKKAIGNIIRSNQVGSAAHTTIAFGIVVIFSEASFVEYNNVENLRITSDKYQVGIDVEYSRNVIVRNNKVHNLLLTDATMATAVGIGVFGGIGGTDIWVYNNKVWDIKTAISSRCAVRGIYAWNQNLLRIENNTVVLTKSDDANASAGSDGIRLAASNTNTTIRNNIIINTREDSPGLVTAITMLAPQLLSDYNDLFVGSGEYSYIGFTNAECKTLDQWKTSGMDINSVSVLPLFTGPNLHIDTTNILSNALNDLGTPITGIAYDFDGRRRDKVNPDIGADEFDEVLTGVSSTRPTLPDRFALEQNYPNPFNPSTTIRYALPSSANVQLAVYDVLGREIATLINEEQSAGWKEVTWNAIHVSSGIYIYKLTAGNFTEVKKMSLIR